MASVIAFSVLAVKQITGACFFEKHMTQDYVHACNFALLLKAIEAFIVNTACSPWSNRRQTHLPALHVDFRHLQLVQHVLGLLQFQTESRHLECVYINRFK